MYICSSYKLINSKKDIREYKKLLKEISSINLRRSSKFNIISVYGALKALENCTYEKDLAIYLASEYACANDMFKVINQVHDKDEIVMPFDFLNINTNNAGFYISQALNTIGNSQNITSSDLSFEKAFELAYFDLSTNEINQALVGGVDEALEDTSNAIINNTYNKELKDGTSWIYLSNNREKAIAKVVAVETFQNIKELNLFLKNILYDKVSLNLFAKQFQEELLINKSLVLKEEDEFYGTYSAGYIVNLLKEESKLLHISLDENKKAYLFYFHKVY